MLEENAGTAQTTPYLVAPKTNRYSARRQEFKDVQNLSSASAVSAWLVAIGTIIAGAVGVTTSWLSSSRSAPKEIGIRKSLGATLVDRQHDPAGSAGLSPGIAGYVGLAAGCATIAGISYALKQLGMESEFFANRRSTWGHIHGLLCPDCHRADRRADPGPLRPRRWRRWWLCGIVKR